MSTKQNNAAIWGNLVRFPNLFTVPGDALIGFFLVSGVVFSPAMALAGLSVLFIYIGGLLFNDYFDREIDARQRPVRPLPSGDVKPETVFAAAIIAMLFGSIPAFFMGYFSVLTVLILIIFVIIYNAGAKKNPLTGLPLLGGCRFLSVMTGAAFADGSLGLMAFVAAAAAFLYTVSLSIAALDETRKDADIKTLWLPVLVWPVVFGAVLIFCDSAPWPLAFIFAAGCFELLRARLLVAAGIIETPAFIGLCIRVMIWSQLFWLFVADWPGYFTGLLFLIIFILFRFCAGYYSKKFYGS